MATKAWVLLLLLGGCGGSLPEGGVEISLVEPSFGPVAGGVSVTIRGDGFLADGAPPNRVLIGDVEAPLAAAVDDQTLVVLLPPGEAGMHPVTVFNRNGQATAEGMFRYSTAPTVTGSSPASIVYNSTNTTVTLTGTGFFDEDAGPSTVLVDGRPAVDVVVQDDTTLTFTAPPGTVLDRPTLTLTNLRGQASRPRSYRYILSSSLTLMVFTKSNQNTAMYLYEPISDTVVAVANKRKPENALSFRGMTRDGTGGLQVLTRDDKFGQLDIAEQRIVEPTPVTVKYEDFERVNSTLFAVTSNNQVDPGTANRFGRFDPLTQTFTAINTLADLGASGRRDLAYNGTTLYLVGRNTTIDQVQISTINPATGALGARVNLDPQKDVAGMTFVGSTLWAITKSGELINIVPATGAVSVIKALQGSMSSVEVFE